MATIKTQAQPTGDAYPDLSARLGATRYRLLHVARQPRVVEALASIAGYVAARRAVLAVANYSPELAPPPPDAATAMANVILEAAYAGEPIPRRVTEVVADQEAFRRHSQAAERAVISAREAVANRLDSLVDSHLSTVRDAIASGLVEVIGQARDVARECAPPDAETAIAEGRVGDFRAVAAIQAEYFELQRLHQTAALADPSLVGLTGDPLQYGHFLKNPSAVWDVNQLRDLGAARGEVGALSGTGIDLPESWTIGTAVWWWTTHPQAQPWVPTHHEVQQMLSDTRLKLAETARAEAQAQPVEALR